MNDVYIIIYVVSPNTIAFDAICVTLRLIKKKRFNPSKQIQFE
jgi:hypothetical protein